MNTDYILAQIGRVPPNNPALAGVPATHKDLFGEHNRYALYPIHTRFDAVQWFVADADIDDNGMPGIIRQADRWQDALAELVL